MLIPDSVRSTTARYVIPSYKNPRADIVERDSELEQGIIVVVRRGVYICGLYLEVGWRGWRWRVVGVCGAGVICIL